MEKAIKRYFPVFALPTLAAFTIGFILPFLLGIYLSFCEFTTVTDARFVGIRNYLKIWGDSTFIHALWFTALFTIISVLVINVLAFAIAMLLTKGIPGTNAFRTVFFMPNLIGGHCTRLYLAVDFKRYFRIFREDADLQRLLRLLGTDYSDVLAADWLHDDYLYFGYSKCAGRADRGRQNRRSDPVSDFDKCDNSNGYAVHYYLHLSDPDKLF